MPLRVSPVRSPSSERDSGPSAWSARTSALRFARRMLSLRCPLSPLIPRPPRGVCAPRVQTFVTRIYECTTGVKGRVRAGSDGCGSIRSCGGSAYGVCVAVAGDRRGRRMRRSDATPAGSTAPHFVADGGGIDHRYEGDFQYFVGGGVAAFDCDDDGRSELYLAGGSAPAALYHNESPTGGALRFTPLAVAGHRPDGGHGRLPARRRRRRAHRSRRAARRRGRRPARARRLPVRAGQRVARHRRRRLVDRRLQRDVGGRRTSCPTLGVRRLPRRRIASRARTAGCCDRPANGERYAPPLALAPGYCTLSVLFSDWNRSGQRDLRVTNDRHYYRDGTDQLWRDRAG